MMRMKQRYWQFLEGEGRVYKKLLLSLIAELKHLVVPVSPSETLHYLPYDLIVSLTSYPPRFKDLHKTIKTLVNKSLKPDKVILWISYSDKALIPHKVKQIEKKVQFFNIMYCDDLGPG